MTKRESHSNFSPANSLPHRGGRAGVRGWRVLLFLILLAGSVLAAWHGARPTLREFRAAQRLNDDLPYVGMIAENAEGLLGDEPDDPARTLGELLSPLFDAEESLAAVRIWDTRGSLVCEVSRDDPKQPRTRTALADLPAPPPPGRLTEVRRDLIFQLQQIMDDQRELSDRMDAALRAEKGGGQHIELCNQQDNILDLSEMLKPKLPSIEDAMGDMRAAREAMTHNESDYLYKALNFSQDAEADTSLALEDLRAVTDFPRPLPRRLASAADWLPLRARRVTAPLYAPTGDASIIAPAGVAEVIFYDRVAATAWTVARGMPAVPRRWLPPAILLFAALLTLVIRKRRKPCKSAE